MERKKLGKVAVNEKINIFQHRFSSGRPNYLQPITQTLRMRKLYIAFLSVFAFLLVTTQLTAQAVSGYVFSTSSGTYTAITGTASTATGDDGIQAGIPIGFNFTFGGTAYSHVAVTTNGYLRLGTTAAVAITGSFGGFQNANFLTTADIPLIAPLWDDMNLTGGDIQYSVTGTAGSQIFTIQWTNNHWSDAGGSGAPTNSYQVKLYEGTNAVQFIYGTMNGSTAGAASIGIRDAAGFQSVTPGAPATVSTVTANNTISSAANLTSGTTYTFTPPPPCVPGSLNGGTINAPASVCSGVSFTVSVAGASFGTGLTYAWESSPNGTTWTPIASATGANLTTTQTAATYYRRKMTCSGTDAYSTAVQVTLNPLTDCYCVPTPASSCASSDVITNVTLGTLNNTSACNAGYGIFTTGQPVPSMLQTLTYPISVSVGPGGTENVAVWIDYNQNGVFEASEYTFIGTGNGVTVSNNITIPPGATVGNTRMRVRVRFSTMLAAGDACLSYGFGETEDYTVNIAPAPPCIAPTAVTSSAITTTSFTIGWTEPTPLPGVGYEWEVRTSGAAGSGATGLAASGSAAVGTTTANVPALTANTGYTVYVRSVCTAGTLYSSWTTGLTVRTACNVVVAFPFTETFETASVSRPCWKVNDFVSGNLAWTYGAGAGNGGTITTAHGGASNARFFGNGTGATTRLVSPAFDMTSLVASGADLTFWYANENWLGDQNELRVYYKTSAAGTWTLLPGAVYTSNVGAWTQVEIQNLPNLSNDYYIGFEGVELFGRGVAIDDVVIKAAPSCRPVTALSAFSPLPTQAVVSFTSPGNAFVVEYGPVGFVPGTTNTAGAGTVVLGAASPITINGLTPGTAYDVYVRQICVPGVDFSTNAKTTVNSLCTATNIPYVQNFETSTPPTGFPTCTSMQDVNGNSGPDANVTGGRWTTFTGTSGDTYVSPTKAMRYLYDFANSTRAADDWFFIQGLNLTAGQSYRLKFFYKGSDGPTWTERLEVKYGTAAQASSMTNTLYTNNNIATALASPWDSARVDFTPATTGVYYIGFHAMSLPDQAFLYIDDISVRIAPVVDAGVTGISTTLPTCPANNNVVKATIRNFNLTTLNFATYPVTVTATITGAQTATLTTVVNTGTLAPGASMDVSLPAFNFTAGLYNITYATSQPNDTENANDAFTTSVFVNATPPVATFTPATPSSCALISTQFAIPPAAPVTLPAVSSGTLALAIPDGSPVGVTNSLTVSGAPAGSVVTGISVTLNATHTWNSDLTFNLRAPNGRIYNLVRKKGGSGVNFTNAVISSASANPLPTGNVTVTGTFAADGTTGVGPNGFVSNASSWAELYAVANGTWTLGVMDDTNLDAGTLTGWSITITYGTTYPTVTWSPAAGLFTDAAGTIPYVANTNAYSVYANPGATTVYTVTSTSNTGCVSSSTVTVNPLVNITALPAKICTSDEIVPLTASPAGGVWSGVGVSGNSFIPVATAIGSYPLTYRYTNASGCTAVASVTARVQDCPERVVLLRDNAVTLYPNPNTGKFFVRINSVLYNKLTLRVYNTNGMVVHSRELTGLAYNRVVPVDLTHLPGGTYMVQFYYDGGVRTSDKVIPVIIAH